MKLTVREQLLGLIEQHPGLSAFELASRIHRYGPDVASMLRKMANEGLVTRVAGEGPRGGFCYYPKKAA